MVICPKGMDGRHYHHYASSDRMWYMPEHPGPYPVPSEPATLEELGILPLMPETPRSPVPGKVKLSCGEGGGGKVVAVGEAIEIVS